MKKHFIDLTNRINTKLKKIKKEIRTNNINETISYLIESYKLKEDEG